MDPSAYCTSMYGVGYTCSGMTCVTAARLVGGWYVILFVKLLTSSGGVANPSAYCSSLYGPGYTCSGVSCVPVTTPTPPIGGWYFPQTPALPAPPSPLLAKVN